MAFNSKHIPYGRQWIGRDDIAGAISVLKSDFITQGPKIKEFEGKLARYCGAKYAVAVSNGTVALHIACLAVGFKKDDEVISTPISFVASTNCVLHCGGRPVFADIQRDTINIDPFEIKKKLTLKTKGIIPVHFAGHPCDLEEIKNTVKKRSIIIIEDACHALGAEYKGAKIGSCRYSDMAVFSFHPVKSITTGEGGAVLTNRKDLYERLILFRNHGIVKNEKKKRESCGGWYYEMRELGFNYRMTDIQAALGITQLDKLDGFVRRRREIAGKYNRAFRDNIYFDIPVEKEYAFSSYHLYPIRLKSGLVGRRKEIFSRFIDNGFGVQVHYIPIYRQPYYRKLGFSGGLCPAAEDYYRRQISIPMYPALKDIQIRNIIKDVFAIIKNINRKEP